MTDNHLNSNDPFDSFKLLENFVLGLKGKEWQKFDLKEREKIVKMCFYYWRVKGFPLYSLSDTEILKEYNRLKEVKKEQILLGDEIQMSMVGMNLANFFHPKMWKIPVKGVHSPFERFNSDEKLLNLIQKALSIWPNRYSVNESNLRRMLKSFSNTGGVSNFRPTAAKAIYEEYSSNGECVLDFSAGFGGRLLGCLPLNRQFLGIDPCKEQIQGLRNMISKIKSLTKIDAKTSIQQNCAEDYLKTLKSNSVSLIFSSPPYFDHERYSIDPSQSYIRYPNYDNWLKFFIKAVILESQRILKPDGYFVINVANVKDFELADDVQSIASTNFKLIKTLKLRLGHLPYLRHRTGHVYKHEPIFIFKKI